MITDDELGATIRAGQPWARDRDIPDPVGWADLAHDVGVTVEVIRGRNGGKFTPVRAHTLPLPKGVGAELRQLTVPDPFDDVVFRAMIGRAAATIDDSLGSEVSSYRLADSGSGWNVRDYRYANGLRIDELRSRVADSTFSGLGILDVRNYYPSIDIDRLEAVLLRVGCHEMDAAAVTGYLRDWQMWGVRGVPVGVESSGLLGNVFMVSVDHALRRAGVEFGRYTDDFRIWLTDPTSWPVVHDVVGVAVEELGLHLNQAKTRHLRTPHGALMQLTNFDIDRLKELLSSDPEVGLSATLDLFDAEVAKLAPDPKRLKFLLGVLRNRASPYGLGIAQNRVELLQADPRAWASYFSVMRDRKLLDMDWLFDVATAETTPATAAVKYHLMRVIAAGSAGRDHGRTLGEFATDNDRNWVPVRCVAAEAWSNSDAWSVGSATEASLRVGDSQQRRALALTLRRASPGRNVDTALRKLHSCVPESRPAVKWIRDGGSIAA